LWKGEVKNDDSPVEVQKSLIIKIKNPEEYADIFGKVEEGGIDAAYNPMATTDC
jgi:hypothetical protein